MQPSFPQQSSVRRLRGWPSPAKVNLNLAVRGRRADGFHDLVSVVAQTAFGDSMDLEWDPEGDPKADSIEILNAVVPAANTVSHALRKFREITGLSSGQFAVRIHKRIPIGAGLGGGSSNAVALLRAASHLLPEWAGRHSWENEAAAIGSDCPLFLSNVPVIMSGRGEIVEPLPEIFAERLRGQALLLCKPPFSINTGAAFARLAAGNLYSPEQTVQKILGAWTSQQSTLPPAGNDFERLLPDWLPSLECVLEQLRSLRLDVRLSGSGSAFFIAGACGPDLCSQIEDLLHQAWGGSHWLERAHLH